MKKMCVWISESSQPFFGRWTQAIYLPPDVVSTMTWKHIGPQKRSKTSEGGDYLSLSGCGGVGQMKKMGNDFPDGREKSSERPRV